MFQFLPLQKTPLGWVNLINKGIWFCGGLLTEEVLFLDRRTNYQVCVSLTPAPLYVTSSSRKGKKTLPLEPHIPQGGKPLNQCYPSSPLLRISASFGAVTECFVWSAAAFAFQSGLAILASEQHALPQSGHLSCWASSIQGDSLIWGNVQWS